MLGAEWIVAIAACLIGAGMVIILTKNLDSISGDSLKVRVLYLIAAGWLVLFSVFLMCVLASALEALNGN